MSLLFSYESSGCSCARSLAPLQGFNNSKAVFTARVKEFKQNKHGFAEKVLLKIDRVWKGNIGETLEIDYRKSGCQYWVFKERSDYLVYTYTTKNKEIGEQHQVSMCSRTKLLIKGQIETQYLDAIIAGKETQTIDHSLPSILANETMSANFRIEAAQLLTQMFYQTPKNLPVGTIDAFIKASKSNIDELKILVAGFFNNQFKGRLEAKQTLLYLLKDQSYKVRNAAASAISRAVKYDPDVFEALKQNMLDTKEQHWENKNEQLKTITYLVVSLSKFASTDYEKETSANLLDELIDKIDDPYQKVSVIQHLGFLSHYATKSIMKLRNILSSSNHDHVKKYTLSALADVHAIKALDEIKSYLKDRDCDVVRHSILATRKIDPEGFSSYLRNKVIYEIRSRFDQCQFEFIWAIQEIGEDAKELVPFLRNKYNKMNRETWHKKQLGEILKNF